MRAASGFWPRREGRKERSEDERAGEREGSRDEKEYRKEGRGGRRMGYDVGDPGPGTTAAIGSSGERRSTRAATT